MVIERLVLENVGVFAGRNTLELLPPSAAKPIILIGGLNGGGKTTLLEAIHLCLYGRNASWSHRSRQGYLDYLGSLINHQADSAAGAHVEIQFNRMIDGHPVRYTLTRAWRIVGGAVKEAVTVLCNGEPDAILSEHWDEYIEGYLPAKLANLFFFDGEQIKDLADRESASRILSTAVQSLLGLDLVNRLDDDLVVLERRKKLAVKSDQERAHIEDLRGACEIAERNADEVRSENRAVNTDLLRQRGELSDWRSRYRKSGGDLYDRKEQLEIERALLQRDLQAAEVALREIAASAAPLLLVEKQIEKVEAQAEAELKIRHERIVAHSEKARDARIVKELRAKMPSKTVEVVELALAKFRHRLDPTTDFLCLYSDEEFPEALRTLRRLQLPAIREEFHAARDRANRLRETMARLQQQIGAVPAAEALTEASREIADRDAQIRAGEAKTAVLAERLREAESMEQKARTILEKALGSMASELEAMEQDERILVRIPRVRDTLEKFRIQMVARHAIKLERLILESFHQLLRKEDLVKELRINSSTFDLELFGPDRRPLPFERLSAGERQLLATAILWGLAKASGRPLPTIIDTPLGRLDSSHRRNLVQRYFPAVSHQVILLSTDEEIDERYGAMLRPYIGRTYRLAFDSETRSTRVEEGYFFNHEAAR